MCKVTLYTNVRNNGLNQFILYDLPARMLAILSPQRKYDQNRLMQIRVV